MSVLKLRRDMVVVDEEPVTERVAESSNGRAAERGGESDRPFPLRTREADDADIIEADVVDADDLHDEHDDDADTHRTFGQHVRFWFNTVVIVGALGAYPAMVIASSDVGDRNLDALVNRSDWTAPWVGGVATLMEQHFNDLGWASDSEAWEPMARLTAKPAYQTAMAASLGDVIRLANAQAAAAGSPDVDLEAAARLVKEDSTGVQLRAARDALLNHDRRLRRRDAATDLTASQISEDLKLVTGWAALSQERIIASASTIGGSPMDEEATRAVYAAKGRAAVAFLLLDSMKWRETADLTHARNAAMSAWKHVAEFHPLVVLNGDTDGSLWGNHPAAMSFLISRAEAATRTFEDLVKAATPAPASAATAATTTVATTAATTAAPSTSR